MSKHFRVKFAYIGNGETPRCLTSDKSWNGKECFMYVLGSNPIRHHLYTSLNEAYGCANIYRRAGYVDILGTVEEYPS